MVREDRCDVPRVGGKRIRVVFRWYCVFSLLHQYIIAAPSPAASYWFIGRGGSRIRLSAAELSVIIPVAAFQSRSRREWGTDGL